MLRLFTRLLVQPMALCCLLIGASATLAANGNEPALIIKADGQNLSFSRADLLARPDVENVTIPDDVAYPGRTMTYRAIPLANLLAAARLPVEDTIQITATDGFIAHLAAKLLASREPDSAHAYLAIEPANAPWPPLKGKSVSAGPFYVVWTTPERSKITPEQWPYQIASLESSLDPVLRWPAINIPADLPADHPARAGLTLFLQQCFTCHAINGGGDATLGPDLNLPMNPTEYFQSAALRQYIRAPESVRTWPDRKMPGFGSTILSESDLDKLIAYLAIMPKQRK